jgi:hypothetical protein
MTARIISRDGVEEVSDREFFARVFGRAPRTRTEREAEWNADCERYADMIEAGGSWAVPPPYLSECHRLIALREKSRSAA